MSEVQEEKPKSFTDIVKPPEDDIVIPKETIQTAQDRLFGGLTDEQASITLDNMKKLAPLDNFTIGGKDYERKKVTPKMLREIKQAEREYLKAIKQEFVNPEDRVEEDYKLLQFKAEKYFGMTKEEFEDTDIEYLRIVLEATELRTQGFRRC